MQITKLEHATLLLREGPESLLIDPGHFLRPLAELGDLAGLQAVVITHEHPDHWEPNNLKAIADAAPDAVIYGPAGVVAAVGEVASVVEVSPGETITAGAFTLQFFGGTHAVIHASIPVVDNVGVLVNDALYYPGDSFVVPEGIEVAALAAPVGAPWLKIADAMDFVVSVAPKIAFSTHEFTLSADIGLPMHRQRLQAATEQVGGTFVPLEPGESLEL